ncbi:MAG: hypothetical protein J0H74_18685 [Chitinophagaceae bacterium]|nr:hypothetical protein [Chitinophagaceae bacterium]
MKKTLLFAVLSIAASILIITSCKKSDSPAYSAEKLAGTYKLTAATSTSGGITIDRFAEMEDCEKDNILKILASPKTEIEFIDAGIICGGGTVGDSHSESLAIKGNLFILSPGTDMADTSTIKSFNGSTLVITTTEENQGISILNTSTLTKQ